LKEKDHVTPGDQLATCGNSGRSPQPHLHLQVQREPSLGSPTHPFHLTSVLVGDEKEQLEYQLVARPQEGRSVQAAEQDEQLSAQLHLPVGRTLRYKLAAFVEGQNKGEEKEVELRVELTLLGQFRLVSDSGASAAFEETNGVLAFYDRQGPKDILLDSWMLANGLTPLTDRAHRWHDAPSASLLPLTILQRAWLWLWRPLGCGLVTLYQRQWDHNSAEWTQSGEHKLKIGGRTLTAITESIFNPVYGCVRMKLALGSQQWLATLVDTGQVADRGVPGWSQRAPQTAEPKNKVDSVKENENSREVVNG
jgi:hypothetical protein